MSTMASRGNKKWLIYVASALIFSIAHGLNPNVSILGLVNIALVGILFAYMFYATNSLWLPIGYHITWNYLPGECLWICGKRDDATWNLRRGNS